MIAEEVVIRRDELRKKEEHIIYGLKSKVRLYVAFQEIVSVVHEAKSSKKKTEVSKINKDIFQDFDNLDIRDVDLYSERELKEEKDFINKMHKLSLEGIEHIYK